MSVALALVGALAQPGAAFAGESSGQNPAQAAREAYNAGRYAEAAAGFLTAVQQAPGDADLYRGLARARVWSKDYAGAVVAYRFYLSLATGLSEDERQKLAAELDNALKQLATPPPEGPPAGPAKLMAEARKRADAGDVPGALDKAGEALAKGYFAPDLGATQAALVAPLAAEWQRQLAEFHAVEKQVDPTALERVRSGYERLARQRPLNVAESAAAGGAAGLAAFSAGRHPEAVTLLLPHAPTDPRLRVALSLSLLATGRADDAAAGLASLNSDDRHVLFLLGAAQRAAGQDPTAALRRALGED